MRSNPGRYEFTVSSKTAWLVDSDALQRICQEANKWYNISEQQWEVQAMMMVIANRSNNNDSTLPESNILSKRVFTVGDYKTCRYGWSTFSVPPNWYSVNVIKEIYSEFFQGGIKPKTLMMNYMDRENRRTIMICPILSTYEQHTMEIWYSSLD